MKMVCESCGEISIVENAFTAGFVQRQCTWCGNRQTVFVDANRPKRSWRHPRRRPLLGGMRVVRYP